jgi:biotin operon repressor
LALADRANNRDGQTTITHAAIAERVGVASRATVRTAIRSLEDAGLVSTAPHGHGVNVKVHPTPARQRLTVPVAAMWEAATGGPRASANPRAACAVLLTYLHFVDFTSLRAWVRQDKVAEVMGVQRRQAVRAINALRETLGPDVMVEAPTYRRDGTRSANEVTFDWSALPAYLTRAQFEQQLEDVLSQVHATLEGSTPGQMPPAVVASADTQPTDDIDYLCELLNDHIAVRQTLGSARRSQWRAAVEKMTGEGYSLNQIRDLILWSTHNQFWKPKIKQMPDIARHALTLSGRGEFIEWLDENGAGVWQSQERRGPRRIQAQPVLRRQQGWSHDDWVNYAKEQAS